MNSAKIMAAFAVARHAAPRIEDAFPDIQPATVSYSLPAGCIIFVKVQEPG